MQSRHRDPQRPAIFCFQLPHPTLSTGILRQGCGVESPTMEAEQPEGDAREDLVDRRHRRTPWRLRDAEEGVFQRFPSSRREIRSFTPFLIHTHCRWGSIGRRDTAADRGRQGGLPYGISSVNRGSTSTGTSFLAHNIRWFRFS